ncbi:MAG: hypothetical protein J6Y55_04380, partial [Bacteroidales bacterium]|nr:hypothetical protein [Bacteroidales bacterium]
NRESRCRPFFLRGSVRKLADFFYARPEGSAIHNAQPITHNKNYVLHIKIIAVGKTLNSRIFVMKYLKNERSKDYCGNRI